MGTGVTGGASWTPEWTKFDNSYFQVVKDPKDEELLALETDTVLFKDPEFLCALFLFLLSCLWVEQSQYVVIHCSLWSFWLLGWIRRLVH